MLSIKELEGTAGVTSWLSSDYHYRLQVIKKEDNINLSLIRHIHDFEAVTEEITLPYSEIISLKIFSDDENYYFYANDTFVGKATVYGLAAEGTMYNTFTGALFGIYSENGRAKFLDKIEMKTREINR